MKKIKKKILAIIILIILAFDIVPINEFVYALQSQYTNYVALGDSIAYGYGLDDRENDSYAAKVKKNYNISDSNYKNLSVSGMKCSDFYIAIQKTEYTNVIKNANLITISVGSNELVEMAEKIIGDVTGISPSESNFTEKVQEKITGMSMLQQYQLLGKIYEQFTSNESKAEIQTAVDSYETNWKKSIEYIKSINNDATIVATEFYNPYYEVALGSYDLGGYVDEWIKKLNVILDNDSNNEEDYKIAKIYDSFNTTNPRVTNVSTSLDNINIDPHPNTLGHDIISKKIIDALTPATISEPKTDIATLTISDIKDQTYTGNEIKPTVVVKDGDITLKENEDFTISYTNNINIGQAKIILLGIGNYEGKVEKTFNIIDKSKVDISNLTFKNIENQTYTGIKITPEIEIYDGTTKLTQKTDYELSYSNNINVGTAKITVTGVGNYEGTKTLNFKIIAKEISNAEIKEISDQTYTGSEIKPSLSITDGSAKLVEDKEYSLQYLNNTKVGQATIKITGRGNYTGTKQVNFNIIEDTTNSLIDIVTLNITNISNQIYTGKLITPEVSIKNGTEVLTKGIDYIINYENNIDAGTATAIIKGIGKYTGEITKNFEIEKKNIDFTTIEDIANQLYTGNEIKPDLKITSDFIDLEEGVDYVVEYSNNIQEGTATIKIRGIGNYTGEVTKTFNIVTENEKEEEEENQENSKQNTSQLIDKTTANSQLPYTGYKFALCGLIIIGTYAIVFYRKYKYMDK